MDRLSFITGKHLDNTETIEVPECGAEDCRCDKPGSTNEILRSKKQIPIYLLLITMMAFLCAAFFSATKNYANASAEMIRVSRQNAISCSPAGNFNSILLRDQNNSNKTSDDHLSTDNSYPVDDNNGNGCPHQQASNALCQPTDSKRRLITIHTC